ncbi:MAG: hemerythrin family protein [Magnetococcales bacterium]|nr:hemerythrin family protein [Magnetococcales bacterium]
MNTLIDLPEEYRLGQDDIDLQHAVLYSLINMVESGLETNDQSNFEMILGSFVSYTYLHFRHEEGRMNQDSYSDYEMHLREHANFEDRAKHYSNALKEDQSESAKKQVLTDMHHFLLDWLGNHINRIDRELFSKEAQYL